MLGHSRTLESYVRCLQAALTILPRESLSVRPDRMSVLWGDSVLLWRHGDC